MKTKYINNSISKRKFIKQGLYGIGALSCGNLIFNSIGEVFGKEIISNSRSPLFDLDKHSVEAHYYIETPKGLKCLLCPNECKITEDEPGECRTRINVEGKLFCIAYGNPCAIHIDPIEKKPLYHFLPASKTFSIATAGCNLACLNCQNWEISQSSPTETRNYDLMPHSVVMQCKEADCNSIAYTYSDPVAFYEYTLETSKIAKKEGIKNIIVSAGYIKEKPLREWCKYIDAANIDLKSFSNELYEMLNAGTLQPVLDTLKILKEEGIWLEITNLIVPDWTDDQDMIKKMCDWLAENGFQNSPLHFSRFHPQYKLTNLPMTPVSVLEKARDIAINSGLNYVYIGNVPGSDAENTFCPNCNNRIITRKGFNIQDLQISDSQCNFCKEKIYGIWD